MPRKTAQQFIDSIEQPQQNLAKESEALKAQKRREQNLGEDAEIQLSYKETYALEDKHLLFSRREGTVAEHTLGSLDRILDKYKNGSEAEQQYARQLVLFMPLLEQYQEIVSNNTTQYTADSIEMWDVGDTAQYESRVENGELIRTLKYSGEKKDLKAVQALEEECQQKGMKEEEIQRQKKLLAVERFLDRMQKFSEFCDMPTPSGQPLRTVIANDLLERGEIKEAERALPFETLEKSTGISFKSTELAPDVAAEEKPEEKQPEQPEEKQPTPEELDREWDDYISRALQNARKADSEYATNKRAYLCLAIRAYRRREEAHQSGIEHPNIRDYHINPFTINDLMQSDFIKQLSGAEIDDMLGKYPNMADLNAELLKREKGLENGPAEEPKQEKPKKEEPKPAEEPKQEEPKQTEQEQRDAENDRLWDEAIRGSLDKAKNETSPMRKSVSLFRAVRLYRARAEQKALGNEHPQYDKAYGSGAANDRQKSDWGREANAEAIDKLIEENGNDIGRIAEALPKAELEARQKQQKEAEEPKKEEAQNEVRQPEQGEVKQPEPPKAEEKQLSPEEAAKQNERKQEMIKELDTLLPAQNRLAVRRLHTTLENIWNALPQDQKILVGDDGKPLGQAIQELSSAAGTLAEYLGDRRGNLTSDDIADQKELDVEKARKAMETLQKGLPAFVMGYTSHYPNLNRLLSSDVPAADINRLVDDVDALNQDLKLNLNMEDQLLKQHGGKEREARKNSLKDKAWQDAIQLSLTGARNTTQTEIRRHHLFTAVATYESWQAKKAQGNEHPEFEKPPVIDDPDAGWAQKITQKNVDQWLESGMSIEQISAEFAKVRKAAEKENAPAAGEIKNEARQPVQNEANQLSQEVKKEAEKEKENAPAEEEIENKENQAENEVKEQPEAGKQPAAGMADNKKEPEFAVGNINAKQHIEDLQAEMRNMPVPSRDDPGQAEYQKYYQMTIAMRIFAARIGIDAVSGSWGGKSLNVKRNHEIEGGAMLAMAKNGPMQDWLEAMPYNKLRKLILTGHGGEMEKEFRSYLLGQPEIPGNTPSRFLPTAKARCESLQAQIKAAHKAGKQELEIELCKELIITRKAVGAQRGGEGLKKRIRQEDLAKAREAVEADKALDAAIKNAVKGTDPASRAARDLVLSGHGGEFLNRMEAGKAHAQVEIQHNAPEAHGPRAGG